LAGPVLHPFDGTDESIPTPGYGFDVSRGFSRIQECLAKTRNGGVETAIEVDHRPIGPEAANQFFPADNLPGALEKSGQDTEGLFLKPDAEAQPSKLGLGEVHLECPEADNLGNPRHSRRV
jgi:hypothetical protein